MNDNLGTSTHDDINKQNNTQKQFLSIGEAARVTEVHAKMIRHYESIGLIQKAKRTEAGYRIYDSSDIHTLQFIKRARNLGFSVKEIKKLLSLWRNRSRASAEVKTLAIGHMQRLNEKIEELKSMKNTLEHLVQHCHGDGRPHCPILEGLSQGVKVENVE